MTLTFNTAVEIILRCLTVYTFVLLALRISGKRQLGQMTPFDLVLLLLISNAVQNAMTGPDTSLWGGMIAAGTLVFMNVLIGRRLLHTRLFRRWIQGTPAILVNHGTIIPEHMTKENIDPDELFQALREHGINSLHQVRLAVLELDGSISIVQQSDLKETYATSHHHRIKLPRHSAKQTS